MNYRYVVIRDGKALLDFDISQYIQSQLDIMKEERGLVYDINSREYQEFVDDIHYDFFIMDSHPDKPSSFPEWQYLVFGENPYDIA